jgi:hypothetical protein
MKIAAITMVYNEPDFLPIWVRHYAGQLGAANCFVIDHGTDDGSTGMHPDVTFIRLPRSPLDDTARAAQIGDIVASLLKIYDAVIHTDVDEIVFPDPRLHAGLPEFCAANRLAVVTAHGFDVFHLRKLEPPVDPARPVLAQRHFAGFSAAMCKPVLVRKPVRWAPGFHCTTDPVTFSDLYLFHLRWFDFDISLRRLARTREQPWADPNAGGWQRVPDAEYEKAFAGFEARPRLQNCDFAPQHEPLRGLMDAFLASQIGRGTEIYRTALDISAPALWRIPECFHEIF